MPKSVIVAIACLVLATSNHLVVLLLSLLASDKIPLKSIWHVSIGALFIWGFVRGHYEAWKWGRILSGLAVCLALLTSFFTLPMAIGVPGAAWFILMWFMYVFAVSGMFLSLGTESARAYFGMSSATWDRYEEPSAADEFRAHMANAHTPEASKDELEVECPHCGEILEVTEDLVGEVFACPTCDGDIELELE